MHIDMTVYITTTLAFIVNSIVNKTISINMIGREGDIRYTYNAISYVEYKKMYRFHKQDIFPRFMHGFKGDLPITDCLELVDVLDINTLEYDKHSGWFTLTLKENS